MDIESRTKIRREKEEEECCNNFKLCTCIILCLIATFYLISSICVFIYVFYIEDNR